jgi:hypothetical protein
LNGRIAPIQTPVAVLPDRKVHWPNRSPTAVDWVVQEYPAQKPKREKVKEILSVINAS